MTTAALEKTLASPPRVKPASRLGERLIEAALMFCGLFSMLLGIAIALVLVLGTIAFFGQKQAVHLAADGTRHIVTEWMTAAEVRTRVADFFTGTTWDETRLQFGVWPLVVGTLWIVIIAGLVAIPIGLMTAFYLSEYASPRVRNLAKPTLELLAGIPAIVYGFFAITVVTPLLARVIPGLQVPFNQIAGGIVVGIMIIPTVASLSEEAMRAVPRALRDSAIALGANRYDVCTKVVLPGALSGVMASFVLALSRAIGETMAVALACGENSTFTLDPRQGITTLTSVIVRRAKGEIEHSSDEYHSLFVIGLILFVLTLILNLVADRFIKRYREAAP